MPMLRSTPGCLCLVLLVAFLGSGASQSQNNEDGGGDQLQLGAAQSGISPLLVTALPRRAALAVATKKPIRRKPTKKSKPTRKRSTRSVKSRPTKKRRPTRRQTRRPTKKPTKNPTKATQKKLSPPPPPAVVLTATDYGLTNLELTNCAVLETGNYLLHWKLDGATVRGALQSVIPAGYERKGIWMGFGFSDPANGYAGMFQSDVVVAGFVGTDCFAVDYYLQNYPFSDPTCDTKRVPGQAIGVCPDAMFANSAKANNVNMTACSIRNGVVTVEWERPVKASDQWDRQWATGAPAYAVHATGPLSSATAAKPSLERHFLATPTGFDYKLSLGVKSTCPAVLQK